MNSAVSLLISCFLFGLSLGLGIAKPEALMWAGALGVVSLGSAVAALALVASERRMAIAIGRVAQVLDQAAISGVAPLVSREFMDVRLLQLYRALNRFARKRHEQLKDLDLEAERHRAILNALKEGIIVIDSSQKIVRINSAAQHFTNRQALGSDGTKPIVGEPMFSVISKPELLDLITRTFSEQTPQEGELFTSDDGVGRFWMVHARIFWDAERNLLGVVVVFTDVTRLKRLETLRRDFVANVSHELKTPMTSISASVETLLDGALDDPKDARNFVSMIGRQAERLNAIFEDLLSLSRIEQESENSVISKQPCPVAPILNAAHELCLGRAESKGTVVDIECDAVLNAEVNETLMQQAVVNLIDNAIKYSKDGGRVWVAAQGVEDKLEISVTDNGSGISSEHLPRLFERFYRADAARSRTEGGTGLGLAIVKHIAQAHGGQVLVESEVGKGSRFVIEVPLSQGSAQVSSTTRKNL